MKSITIHDLDDDLDRRIRALAMEKGLSLNKTIKFVLRMALGLEGGCQKARLDQFQDLFGAWSSSDFQAFQEQTADFSEVDPADWR